MRAALAAGGVFLLALAVRALPWRTVLVPGSAIPFGQDSYYHLRRIAYSVARFPASLERDPYLRFPDGATPIWTPVFDWLVAAALRPFVEPGDLPALERAAMWVPPVVGALTSVAIFGVARAQLGSRAAWAAGLGLALLSAHFWYSQIGFLDHHAAVALGAAGLLAAGCAWAMRSGGLRVDLALGAACAAALAVWPGSLLHVALVQLACAGPLLAEPDRARARRGARGLARANALAALLLLPLSSTFHPPQWGALSPVVLGAFQPLLLGGLALGAAGVAAAWSVDRWGATPARRRRAAAVAALLLAAAWLALPGASSGLADAWRWLGRAESFQSQVAESAPLLLEDGRLSFRVAIARLSLFVLVLPFAAVLLLREAGPRRPVLRLVLIFTAGLLLATLAQRRFFNSLALGLALVLGASLDAAWRRLPGRWRRGGGAWAGAAALGAAWLALLAPTLATYRPYVSNEWRAARGAPLVVSPRRAADRILLETAAWMRAHTPRTAGWLDPEERPEYGVLGPWDVGHAIQYVARRPAVVDNFGDDLGGDALEQLERYWRAPEAEALEIARGLRAGFVLIRLDANVRRAPAGALIRALALRDGSAGAAPALGHHRLVYESRSLGAAPGSAPLYKVFEIVAGAAVVGRAPAGERVEAELGLRTERGRSFVYRVVGRADDEGRYRLRLAYPSGQAGSGLRSEPDYRLTGAGGEARLAVPLQAVRGGATLPGPDLGGADGTRGPLAL